MSIELVEKMILIIFLLIFTFQDIRKKEIYTFGVVLFYIMIIDIQIYKFIMGSRIDIKNTVFGIFSGFFYCHFQSSIYWEREMLLSL